MNTKTLSILIVTFFLFSCGYTPMFSSNSKTTIYIEDLIVEGDRELSNFIRDKIKRLDDKTSKKKVSITAKTKYYKVAQIKDKSGNTTQYKLNADVNFIIKTDASIVEFDLKESASMQNFSDEFEQKNYERTTKDQFSVIFMDKLIVSLSRIQ